MSVFTFKPSHVASQPQARGVRSAFARWIHANHGSALRAVRQEHQKQRHAKAQRSKAPRPGAVDSKKPLVGIVGGGFAGLFSGLILQSLGLESEVFESSDRVGGRINTWYSTDYSPDDPNRAGLYGEVGGMRLPQFSEDMLPVQQLALAVNSVLERNGLDDQKVVWRKFYYDSPQQRLRYNNMAAPITSAKSNLNSLNFGQQQGGDVPQVWVTEKKDKTGTRYLPINIVLDMVNKPFIDAINRSFSEGFAMMMQYDQYSMWDYLTTVFTLGDMGDYYDPAMGARSDLLPWSVASYLETTNVGTGMYSVSFVEMVIAVYDWGGSKDPYRPEDPEVRMLTVDGGMQRFPDACRTVLDLEDGVTAAEGHLAQVQVGMRPAKKNGPYSYTAPNLTPDAEPPGTPERKGRKERKERKERRAQAANDSPRTRQRVFLRHKVTELKHDPALYQGYGGMKVTLQKQGPLGEEQIHREYPFVIATLPSGAYLNGEFGRNLLNDISFAKAQALRECDYMAAFKAFLTFKTQFWTKVGPRQEGGYGAAATDRPNRQIIYPSYGYDGKPGVLQIYCWAQDARRLGALDDKERIAECLKGIAYLYPDVDVYAEFAGYDDGKTTKTWFWDSHASGGAFALFNPGQFKQLYSALLSPEFGGCLNFAGECASVHHGWILGALDSAYNAVLNILMQTGREDLIVRLKETWGTFSAPDVATDEATVNVMEYAYAYNEVDRKASSIAPGKTSSIYGKSTFEFTGHVPAIIQDFGTVPDGMKSTAKDKAVLAMLNSQWDANVAQRAQKRAKGAGGSTAPKKGATAVELLEATYYGDNFQTIPAPRFWLKDDDEFARQQLAGFMPNLLTRVDPKQLPALLAKAGIAHPEALGPLEKIHYIADYRRYLEACTVIPVGYYLPKPLIFFTVTEKNELMPLGIQLEPKGELFTPGMPNAANAWLLAKMLTNCAGQTLHDVGFHQLLTHQICAMVSVALFSEEVFNPATPPGSGPAFQEHPVFKLLRPHVVKTVEFQQTIYNRGYDPSNPGFPATRVPQQSPGVYNLGFVYDLIFSCGRIGSYQLQDKMYNDGGKFRFLEQAIPMDAERRGVLNTPFSYAYVHDAMLWYRAIHAFAGDFVDTHYAGGDEAVASDVQLQRFFDKLIPAFNHVDGAKQAQRFPASVRTKAQLKEVLAMFMWQFSVQHTVVNDGAYNQAAFVPNASTLMYAPPAGKPSSKWTPADVIACLPSQDTKYPQLGNMNFLDVQLNASVTGQGPYPDTVLGRGVLEPSLDVLQDSYAFSDMKLRAVVDRFYQQVRAVGEAIQLRQAQDIARHMALHPDSRSVPETVVFNLLAPTNVMNTIQT
jgi:monoamine oxidase